MPLQKRNGQSQVSNGNPASRKYGGGDGNEGKFWNAKQLNALHQW
jgi:hypothetical protein